jgi:hypothetical protein
MKPKKEAKKPTAKELGKIKKWIKSLTPEQRGKLRELRTKIWWWRRGEIRHAFKNPKISTALGISFHGTAEEVARNYELMRRSTKGEMCIKENYLELRRWGRGVAYTLWGAPLQPPYRQIFDPKPKPELLGWTVVPHRMEWNLFLDDKTLAEAFLEFINQYRNAQGIPSPHKLKGKKLRGVSWSQIEILDCIKHGILKIPNSTQRSLASKGRRRAEKLFEEYNNATGEDDSNWFRNATNFGEIDDFNTF